MLICDFHVRVVGSNTTSTQRIVVWLLGSGQINQIWKREHSEIEEREPNPQPTNGRLSDDEDRQGTVAAQVINIVVGGWNSVKGRKSDVGGGVCAFA